LLGTFGYRQLTLEVRSVSSETSRPTTRPLVGGGCEWP
jgi:hypothetical protein